MDSLWSQTAQKRRFDALSGDCETDVLIIGGGLAGLLCAHALHRAGVRYLLVEAREIGCGITKNTPAKITLQHGLIYGKLASVLPLKLSAVVIACRISDGSLISPYA